ncbi:PmoA family protein [Lewinella sp. W8]|uniref:DUF6807 domain-containing protein n=1 Tax=Lewinella sp. W8 TaxID=2528208 RepID=UPI00106787A1|nr:PmoA family protein [Lewinella sp. W8]MTB53721.1 hypothetical protein [Lewinella sp. W8]
MKNCLYLLLLSLMLGTCALAPSCSAGAPSHSSGIDDPDELRNSGPSPATAPETDTAIIIDEDAVSFRRNDGEVLRYHLTPRLPDGLPDHYARSGFVHPLSSPAGKVVTDDFPVAYAHQHGLFNAWTNTTFRDSFVDFWNQHHLLGTVAHHRLTDTLREDGFVGFSSELHHLSRVYGKVLEESWTARLHPRTDVHVIDFRSRQSNVTEDTLHLNEYHYGGFGIRGSKHWNPSDSLHFSGHPTFLTSEGLGREAANHSRPAWTAMYGDVAGSVAGVAIFPHPDNYRYPQPVRVHPGIPYFVVSPVVLGAFTLPPGASYLSRFRVVVFDGEPDVELFEELAWE